jgi:protein-disulfide isomerase
MAKYVGVPDVAKFMKEWKSGKYKKQIESTVGQAEKFGFSATPSFAIEGPNSEGLELLGTTENLEEAIEKAS